MVLKLVALGLISATLVGCGATQTAIHNRNDVQTKMSSTVFLDPISSDKRTVYLQIRNTSDKPELNLAEQLKEAMEAKGYHIASTPEQAHYVLQAHILQVGQTDLKATEYALNQGFGTAFEGVVIGSTVSTAPIYSVITDVQVSERVGNSITVQEKAKSKLKQGAQGVKEVTATEKTHWKRYQTRMVSTMHKVNVSFKKTTPALITKMSHSIAGVF